MTSGVRSILTKKFIKAILNEFSKRADAQHNLILDLEEEIAEASKKEDSFNYTRRE